MHRRDFMKALGAGAALSSFPFTRAIAQNTGVVRMIVPLPAGSSNDTSTRLIAQGLGPILGQTVIVENKAGASGVIGTSEVIRAKPDGLTILAGSLSPLAANMAFVKNLPYDPRKDLAAVAGSTLTNHVLVVAPNSPVKTFADFIAYAKERPGKVTIGYSTAIVQLQIVTLNKMAGIELLPVPYKGAPESVTDVMAGVIDATMANPGPTIGFEKSGKLRPLAVTSLKRNSNTPEWPAISETLPGFDFPSWNAFAAPLKTPRDVIDRLSSAIAKAQADPTVIQRLSSEATVPLIMNPDETAAYIAAETEKYVKLGREAGIEPA
jgi:tripartite-type tricarboxylate transporter receptor subunit TctC